MRRVEREGVREVRARERWWLREKERLTSMDEEKREREREFALA